VRPYTADSLWNTPISADAVYEANSSDLIATMGAGANSGRISTDTTRFTFTVYYADENTPRRDVQCVRWKCAIVVNNVYSNTALMTNVPIPDGAQPSVGTDQQFIVIDQTNGKEYGFFHIHQDEQGNWLADNGYQYSIYENGMPPRIGARGAGIAYYAGLIRPWEIRQGHIDHAIAFGYPTPASKACVFPATQKSNAFGTEPSIPYGARMQLNPALTEADFDAWGLSETGRIIARALQSYGMILIDNSGSNKLYAEDLTNNPYATESWSDPDLNLTWDTLGNIPNSQFNVLKLPDAYSDPTAPSALFGGCLMNP
jgi:hypothetical protein